MLRLLNIIDPYQLCDQESQHERSEVDSGQLSLTRDSIEQRGIDPAIYSSSYDPEDQDILYKRCEARVRSFVYARLIVCFVFAHMFIWVYAHAPIYVPVHYFVVDVLD